MKRIAVAALAWLWAVPASAATTGGGSLGALVRMPMEEAIGMAHPAVVIGLIIAGLGLFFGLTRFDPFVKVIVGSALLAIVGTLSATFGFGAEIP